MDSTTRRTYEMRGIGRPQRRGSRPCLLVVDLTYGFTEPASPLGCDSAEALAATSELLSSARKYDVPLAFTRIAYDEADLEIAALFIEKMPALAMLTAGSHAATIDAVVGPAPGEVIFTKLFASAFHGTPLSAMLVARGCDSVIIAGASTSGCVRATAVDALQHGYRVMVPRVATADRARAPHEASLFDIQAKYGEVVELEAAVAALGECKAHMRVPA